MKKILITAFTLFTSIILMAQTDTTKRKSVDTIKIGGLIIIKSSDKNPDRPAADTTKPPTVIKKKKNISTNWWIIDLGFANVNDKTNYASGSVSGGSGVLPTGNSNTMDLKGGKSINVNVWFFQQRVNLIKHAVNLKYGLGLELNNYRYENNIRYRTQPYDYINFDTITFSKNKLAADYITIPLMLDFNFTPTQKRSIGFAAGISAGYLYSARQKMVSDARGKEKVRNDFNINRWKIAAIGELSMGVIKLYGSYALNPLHENGLEQFPYNIGLRLSNW